MVAVITEKEDTLLYIIALVMYALLRIIFEVKRASKVEIICSFMEFQVSDALGLVNFDFSLTFVGILLTSSRYFCLKSPLPPSHFHIPGYAGPDRRQVGTMEVPLCRPESSQSNHFQGNQI